jgi:hypothetical protein
MEIQLRTLNFIKRVMSSFLLRRCALCIVRRGRQAICRGHGRGRDLDEGTGRRNARPDDSAIEIDSDDEYQ